MAEVRKNNQPEQQVLRRKLRRVSTPEEVALWQMVKGKQICGLQFRRQFSVGPYILDFYCPRAKLCVELDGIHHHSEEESEYDTRRDAYLESCGIEVLRIDNVAVWTCSDVVVGAITELVERRLQQLPRR